MSRYDSLDLDDDIPNVEPISIEVYATPAGEEVGRAAITFCAYCPFIHAIWMPLEPWTSYPHGAVCVSCLRAGDGHFRVSRCYPYPAPLVAVVAKDEKAARRDSMTIGWRTVEAYWSIRGQRHVHHKTPTVTTPARDLALPPGRTRRPPVDPLDPRPSA